MNKDHKKNAYKERQKIKIGKREGIEGNSDWRGVLKFCAVQIS